MASRFSGVRRVNESSFNPTSGEATSNSKPVKPGEFLGMSKAAGGIVKRLGTGGRRTDKQRYNLMFQTGAKVCPPDMSKEAHTLPQSPTRVGKDAKRRSYDREINVFDDAPSKLSATEVAQLVKQERPLYNVGRSGQARGKLDRSPPPGPKNPRFKVFKERRQISPGMDVFQRGEGGRRPGVGASSPEPVKQTAQWLPSRKKTYGAAPVNSEVSIGASEVKSDKLTTKQRRHYSPKSQGSLPSGGPLASGKYQPAYISVKGAAGSPAPAPAGTQRRVVNHGRNSQFTSSSPTQQRTPKRPVSPRRKGAAGHGYHQTSHDVFP